MMYALDDLLMKMGAPETREKGQIRWHYFNGDDGAVGGFAEVRLLDGGATLIAELQQWHPVENAIGAMDGGKAMQQTESLYLHARRTGHRYAVTKIAFDGEEYPHPPKSVIELGLSIFHARALDISILMIEQAFNRDDIVHQPQAESAAVKNAAVENAMVENAYITRAPRHVPPQNWGVVVPFRPRRSRSAFSWG